jgi:twitching motility protein PilT
MRIAARSVLDLNEHLTTAEDVVEAIQSARQNERISDIHLDPDATLAIRLDGDFQATDTRLTRSAIDLFVKAIELDANSEAEQLSLRGSYSNIFSSPETGRIRVTILSTAPGKVCAIRLLPERPPTLDELDLPPVFHQIARGRTGLSIVAGPTGVGKSTALAAVTQEVNLRSKRLIYTVDDAMEYVFKEEMSRIRQIRVGRGLDVPTYEAGLSSLLRADPDLIVVSECRTPDSLLAALMLAEAGRRVLITVHIENAARVVDRIVGAFEPAMQPNIRAMIAGVLQEVVYLRLPKRLEPTQRFGRIPACEILTRTEGLASAILTTAGSPGSAESTEAALTNLMTSSRDKGMQLIEDDLADKVEKKIISRDEAWEQVIRPDRLESKIGKPESGAARLFG